MCLCACTRRQQQQELPSKGFCRKQHGGLCGEFAETAVQATAHVAKRFSEKAKASCKAVGLEPGSEHSSLTRHIQQRRTGKGQGKRAQGVRHSIYNPTSRTQPIGPKRSTHHTPEPYCTHTPVRSSAAEGLCRRKHRQPQSSSSTVLHPHSSP